jgi:hypothetical protein
LRDILCKVVQAGVAVGLRTPEGSKGMETIGACEAGQACAERSICGACAFLGY